MSRYVVDVAVTVGNAHGSYAGVVRNVTVAGVFIATHRAHTVGEWIELKIHLPGEERPVCVIGEVRWIREYSGEGSREPGMGVQFQSLSAEGAARIALFLKRFGAMSRQER